MASITALLGPTNTGKTHHAIERMLEHASGMIGLPLRLLAREVYDRVTARVGESRVALVTGEEQRIPPRPAYWVATVEAMPVEREVDFVAVDEVQLAVHTQRGHVFTSRLVHARGRKETWFLGADTMRGVLRDLVPTATLVEHPRLSRLSYAGATPLARLPPRSAVVAFSMPHVYEVADRIRRRRGGAAVVLGALSPRTRNAQVAMFQAGEVDCLVATDAIGMGLNLDVEHVAFASTRKFDGRDVRDVDDAELAQIAGRAGRWIHDGTFGTLSPLELPRVTAHAIETHSFPSVRRVQWRNDDLDFASIAALRASLAEPPRRGIFKPTASADDAVCLALLAARPEIAKRARGEDRVRLLWDVCTVPDFRKLMIEVHADFLAELYVELVDHGVMREDWIEERVRDLEQMALGDVDDLVARIAAVRTWTYASTRTTWLADAEPWQERTRRLEDRLSDALHERLVTRFVNSQTGRRPPRRKASAAKQAPVDAPPVAIPSGHPFAKLASLQPTLRPKVPPAVPTGVDTVIDAPHEAFTLTADGRIVHDAKVIGHLVRGTSIARPDVRVDEDLAAGAKSRVQRRLLAFARDVANDLTGRSLVTEDSPPLRAFLHRLEQGLGTELTSSFADIALTDVERQSLAGIHFGTTVVFLPSGLEPAAVEARIALATIWFSAARGGRGPLRPPAGGAVSFTPSRGIDRRAYTAIGYPAAGPRAIRADVLERVVAGHREGIEEPLLATWIGSSVPDLRRVLAAMARWRRPCP
jgi:ATP-dependent RNA helicase SUPV3L1/SUV3